MSPRVDFYLLADAQPINKLLFACRLLEKAYYKGHKIFVFCANQEDTEHFDELLWTFKADSFIPHNIQGEGPNTPPPIQIGYTQQIPGFHDILLNLSRVIPTYYQQFKRIIELVHNDESAKEQSRIHFRHYKTQGCIMHTHQINNVI